MEFLGENGREGRGLILLNEWLSAGQRAQFDSFGYFDVIGSESRQHYRIRYGCATNVYKLADDGSAMYGRCFVPRGGLVPGDIMLAQKIALETD
jgi:hypothetical protein